MMTMTDLRELADNTELEHHGIKGMKWGIRKSEEERAKAKQFKSDVKKFSNSPDSLKTRLETKLAKSGGPEYVEKVRKGAEKRSRRMILGGTTFGVLASLVGIYPKETAVFLMNAKSNVFKAAKYASTVKKGRDFVREFGLEDHVYINEMGEVLKNVVPKM